VIPCSVQAADDAAEADWFDVGSMPELAFDHKEVVADCLRCASKLAAAQEQGMAGALKQAGDKYAK
jgi:hypothetical protein